MSKRWIKPPQTPHWRHRHVAIFKCVPKLKELTEIVVADGDEINKNHDLQRVLRALHVGMLSKRVYPNAINPTIRYLTFREAPSGGSNDAQQLLNGLLRAQTKEQIHLQASSLADRYMSTQNVQKGVLIFLLSEVATEGQAAESCVFLFKCDFEDISQVTPKQVFRKIEDAFEEQAKKGVQYPYFNGRTLEPTVVRVFDSLGETKYWLEFLELGERQSEYVTLQSATLHGLESVRPELVEKYGDELKSLDDTRALASDEQLVPVGDRLSTESVMELIDALPENLSEKKISLTLDGARIAVSIKEYGRTWILAEHEGTRYILIKGAQLEIRTKMLTPFDVSGLDDLPKAFAELEIPRG